MLQLMNDKWALLFFDDQYLDRRENLARRIGQPTQIIEGDYRDPSLDPSWGYPSVFRDKETGIWRCLYQGQLRRSELPTGRNLQHLAVLLESQDGVHWETPELDSRSPLTNRVRPNQVLPLDGFGEWGPCFYDSQTTNPEERLKAFVQTRDKNQLAAPLFVSSDGLNWKLTKDRNWHPTGIDPAVSGFWNHIRKSYVIAARPRAGDRRISVYETRDWIEFSDPEVAIRPDSQDSPAAQVYGMPVFPYAHMFIGLLWIYHTTPVVNSGSKFIHGKVDCQLAYSYNGWHFQRCQRQPFLPQASQPGEPGYGCIYPSSIVHTDDNKIRIYSSASEGEHAQVLSEPERGEGRLLLHELRKDGFNYLESLGGPGWLTTRLLQITGSLLSINIHVPHGSARVQVSSVSGEPLDGYKFSDCIAFTGDNLTWEPIWKGGNSIGSLSGQVVRLELELFNGRVFSFRGDLIPTRRPPRDGANPEFPIEPLYEH